MQNDMRAASEYYTWARGQRIFGAAKVLDRRIRDYNDSILDNIDDADTERLIAQAKKFSSDLLNDYIKRHPDREALLSPIAKLADLKEDVHNALHTLFEGNDEKIKNYAQRIDNLYDSSVITNADQALSAFEDLVDGSEGEVSEDFNNILEKLKDYNWLRNATKLEERKVRKEEEAKLDEEKRKKEDGSSYGWEGYKVGDTVYHTTKRTNYTGYVVSFDPITNAMHVRWGENKTTEAITDKSKVTKDPAVRNSSQETADKGSDAYMPSESSLEEGTGRTLFSSPKSLDSEGSVVTPSPEQEGKAAEAASDVQVIAPTLQEPVEIANKLAPLEGVLIGNALYPVWFFQGMERMKYITFLNILSKLIFLVLIFIFVKKESDYILAPLLNSAGFLVSGAIGLYFALKQLGAELYLPKLHSIKKQFKYSSQFFLSRVSVSAYTNTNTFCLGLTGSNIMTAYYIAAEKIYNAVNGLSYPVNGALYPFIAKNRDIKTYKKIFTAACLGNFCICAFIFIFAQQFINIFFGSEMIEAYKVLRIFCIISLFVFPSMLLGYPLIAASGYVKEANESVIAGSLIHIAGLSVLFFSGRMDIYSIAFMVMLTEIIVFGIRVYCIFKYKLLEDKK